MIKKLDRMPYAQAYVTKYDDGAAVLTSYRTDVILINADGWMLCTGLYSATTRRHISAFAHEIGTVDYHIIKRAYSDGLTLNVQTGEVLPEQLWDMRPDVMEQNVARYYEEQEGMKAAA